jgi:glycine cleavage system H protein
MSDAEFPADRRFSKDHEWVKVEGDKARVGITNYAQKQLGDVVFLELPDVGRSLKSHETFGTVESVKAVSELFAPVAGEVAERNADLVNAPEAINTDPYGQGWMIVVKLADAGEVGGLMDADAYRKFVESEAK